jgi:hypothetical protein
MQSDKIILSEFETVFNRLKIILQKHGGNFTVKPDTNGSYGLQGKPGPATLKAWNGKMKKSIMPVAWIEIGKSYVSYHIMGLYTNTALQNSMSKELKAHMQGKTCFNFKSINEELFKELEQITVKAIDDFKKLGYVV